MVNNYTHGKNYHYTILAISLLEKLLGSKITVEGIENIPLHPTLFVANHFTRSETIVVPYIIHKYANRQVRCLADSNLFFGSLGKFLRSIGALSTTDKKRDHSIIFDLVNNNYDWIIYPEGKMMKSKQIYSNRKLSSYFFDKNSTEDRVRTGSAILALKSELYRKDLIEAARNGRMDLLKFYKEELGIKFDKKLKNLQTHIIPINITYYPIRPGKNIIQRIVGKIFKQLPKEIAEELEIEGNLLLSSDINISFGKAINLSDYVQNVRDKIYLIPIIKNQTKINLILKYLKNHLTNKFMEDIYSRTQINIDHIVVAILYFYPHKEIDINYFKSLIYISINHIVYLKKCRIHSSLSGIDTYMLFVDENLKQLTSIVGLAQKLKIITKSNDRKSYIIHKNKFEQQYDFQYIRIENTLKVILNEFLLLKTPVDIVKRNVLFDEDMVRKNVFDSLLSKDIEIFNYDYDKYYDKSLSKDRSLGAPLFIDNVNLRSNNADGILLVHGYLSVPKQMEDMAKYFNNLGFKVYLVRLKGHGTAPVNLEDVKWQDWYGSLNFGYEALKLICVKVFIIGFSTGGLLSLLTASRKLQVDGVICINPALKLRDLRVKLSSGICLWNDILDKFRITKGQLRYIENSSENLDINYSRNYINGVEQLESLMGICENSLREIVCPTLIIQSTEDPIVDSKNAKRSLGKISSNINHFQEIRSSKHTIVRGKDSDKVFKVIRDFLKIQQI